MVKFKLLDMKITILTNNPNSWILPYVEDLKKELATEHKIHHVFSTKEITSGDIMLILSCENILKSKYFVPSKKSGVSKWIMNMIYTKKNIYNLDSVCELL